MDNLNLAPNEGKGELIRLSRPCCAAVELIPFENVDCEIEYNENSKEFKVKLFIDGFCSPCRKKWQIEQFVKEVPLKIAATSRCSCGSELYLTNHSIRKTGNIFEFEGQYVCNECKKANKTIRSKIGKALISFWKETRKIEVGPKGVIYEKD